MKLRVGLFGFGRTGSIVAKEIVSDKDLSLEWVCRKSADPQLQFASHAMGKDENFAPFVTFDNLTKEFLRHNPVDIVIDFSSSTAACAYELLAKSGTRIVSAISKYAEEDFQFLQNVTSKTSVLYSPNITLGINWLMMSSRILKKIVPHADIEVVEEHFRGKKEISGTAMKIAGQLELEPEKHVNSIRVGGIIGKHEVIFGLPNQTIRLIHESISRAAFGTGAIFAAKWLHGKPEGYYTMEQVLHEKFIKKINELDFGV